MKTYTVSIPLGAVALIKVEANSKKEELLSEKYIIDDEVSNVNPKTLQIHKQVLGVAPVFYNSFINEKGEDEIEKRIPFLIYFNEGEQMRCLVKYKSCMNKKAKAKAEEKLIETL